MYLAKKAAHRTGYFVRERMEWDWVIHVCIYKAVDAILQCGNLDICFPRTKEEVDKSVADFQLLSTKGIIDGCVACVDGFLLPTKVPLELETGHPLAHFSGHYNTNGLNIQAACNSWCRFLYVAVAAPGQSSNVVAL